MAILIQVCACSVASVMSNSFWPYALYPTRLLCLWDSPGKNIGVGCHALLQGIFPIQGWNPHLLGPLHCRPGGSDGKESACNSGDPDSIDPPEKGLATYSSILAWKIPWTEEPGGLQSMGSQRVGHDWVSTHTHTLRSVLWPLKKSILYTPQKKEGGEHLNKGGRIVLLSTLLRPGLWRTVSSYWSRICREKEPRRFFFFFFPSNG